MRMYERVKKAILNTTIVRCEVQDTSATDQYYTGLTERLQLKELPLISVNTIEKKTYITECNNQYFLVFDHYLMEIMDFLNQSILRDVFWDNLNPFFYRVVSEESYIQNNIPTAVDFASKYMNHLDAVLELYKEENFSERESDYLFVQQAFLIAHELFHFYIHREPKQETQGLVSKERFLKKIYDYVNERKTEIAFFMTDLIHDKNMIEECLCDSTAIMQAIEIGMKVGKLDIVESGVAVAMTLMNQYTISVIQDTVKFSGDISYERVQNLANFRLLHLKEFTSLYIRKIGSEEMQNRYHERVEEIHQQWWDRVHCRIMYMLVEYNDLLRIRKTYGSKTFERRNAIALLKQIYTY